jgi:hypothetical protein
MDLQHVSRKITLLYVINPCFPRTFLPYAMRLDARLDYRINSHLPTIKGGQGWTTGFEGSPQSEIAPQT